jgi:hypothetical protein
MSLIRPQSSGRTPRRIEPENTAPGTAAGHPAGSTAGGRGADALPDPSTLVSNLSLCVIEVLAGARDLNQLARWVSDEVFRHLRLRVALASRAREAKGLRVRRPQVTLGEPRITMPAHGVVEAVVIVHQRGRSRAVAMRLEALDDRWRASAINVL